MKLLIQGAADHKAVPGLESLPEQVSVVFAPDDSSLRKELPGSEVLLAWNFRDSSLRDHWQHAHSLKWIHWCGAGVDAALFDELRASDVVLTNAGGIFDRAMAETVLGYMLFEAKDFATTINHQRERIWQYRMTHQLKGDRALVVGVGSIGREIAGMLRAVGVKVSGAGRSERRLDPDFDTIHASIQLKEVLNNFDWVIGIMPSTPETEGFFDRAFFDAMKPSARFVNLGRGTAVVEKDLIAALEHESIAGAMLDVFSNEPLEQDDPIWGARNLFVSPHISGDYVGFEADMVSLFRDNLGRYLEGETLRNQVDKNLGFVRSE